MLSNYGTLQELLGFLENARERNIRSLPEYSKITNVTSRMYLEESIVNDEVIPDLVALMHQNYIGHVFSALQLSKLVVGGKTVRKLLQMVSTEVYKDSLEVVKVSFGKGAKDTDIVSSMEATKSGLVEFNKGEKKLFAGQLLEISLNLQGSDSVVNILLNVQLLPFFIPKTVASGFIDLNFDPPLPRRLTQISVGEATWINDFFLNRDRILKHRRALKDDKTGVLYNMLNKQQNNLGKFFQQMVGITPTNKNTANTILVTDKRTFDKACNDAGLDFNLQQYRDKFFAKSFMMSLVVVDTYHHIVDIYYHGVSDVGSYTYNQISKSTSGGSKYDLKEVMTAFSGQRAPGY